MARTTAFYVYEQDAKAYARHLNNEGGRFRYVPTSCYDSELWYVARYDGEFYEGQVFVPNEWRDA